MTEQGHTTNGRDINERWLDIRRAAATLILYGFTRRQIHNLFALDDAEIDCLEIGIDVTHRRHQREKNL